MTLPPPAPIKVIKPGDDDRWWDKIPRSQLVIGTVVVMGLIVALIVESCGG